VPATDTPTKAIMHRPSIGCTVPLINNVMWRNLTAFQISVLLALPLRALQYHGLDIFGINEKANGTMIFNVFVLCQVFNEFNKREIKQTNVFAGMLWNKMFLGNIAVLRCDKV
jgi:Ca2+-transporting ATPase